MLPPQPPTGSQESQRPKTRVSSGARTKFGIMIPVMAAPMAA